MGYNTYDKKDPISIYEYSKQLLNKSLREWIIESSGMLTEDSKIRYGNKENKGNLGQNVERYFFNYEPNNNPLPDFEDAQLELKCTGLKKCIDKKGELKLNIKERLVCDLINYQTDVQIPFEESRFYIKCLRMLLLFYLYEKGVENFDKKFIKIALWELPEKDLLIIKDDYNTILDKIESGRAHELSESDTLYLAACRKGVGGKADLKEQPFSPIKAYQRAFSLKPAYMRTILQYIDNHGGKYATNFSYNNEDLQIVTAEELQTMSFCDIIINRFLPYYGLNYNQIISATGLKASSAKHKYALLANGLVHGNRELQNSCIQDFEEFKKSGITMKTIRVNYSGTLKESMSFENIDYEEIYENDIWENSRLYEILTTKFLFVIFKEDQPNSEIEICGNKEPEFKLHKVFFWSMPEEDLLDAKDYWDNIRHNVLNDKIELDNFFHISDHKKFHVRPKGTKLSYKNAARNPNGGMADKYCYWFNASYVKKIIASI